MSAQATLDIFGPAAALASLEDIESLILSNPANPRLCTQAAAFGLSLAAAQAVRGTSFLEDARHVVDAVAKAKAPIDIAAWHSLEGVRTTAAVLLAAQLFLDEQTIACTEWPAPGEVATAVLESARRAVET
ncbi:hypothetical protein [Pseudomonas sp. SO81]|uniref:hypothetical protein n=1 Tax=Pseudomonas sp. SO81 TaxID=2983246 RepID=UPI0025A36517|nr:hypothetical protein [Pseudomonas sp. SO81]WJN61133.1 hypothetical protein OH686_20500 [Pseudomonas sp. SO81]